MAEYFNPAVHVAFIDFIVSFKRHFYISIILTIPEIVISSLIEGSAKMPMGCPIF